MREALARVADAFRASPGEVGLIALLGAVLAGTSVFFIARPPAAKPAPAIREVVSISPSRKMLVVHVSGLVATPGVYELPDGSRVKDAVAAAGGAGPEADVSALNLAAPIADGEKIHVPRTGDSAAAPTGSSTSGGPAAKINLNTASKEQLETLPSIGPVLAQRIIDYRTRRGRFTSVRQLMEVEGLGPKK